MISLLFVLQDTHWDYRVDDSIYYAVAMCMYMDNCTCSVCAGFGGGGRALHSPILVYAQCMMYVQVAKSFIPSIL